MQSTVACRRFQTADKRITSESYKLVRNTKKYPQDGCELLAGNVDGVHDGVMPVDGHGVLDGLGLDGCWLI